MKFGRYLVNMIGCVRELSSKQIWMWGLCIAWRRAMFLLLMLHDTRRNHGHINGGRARRGTTLMPLSGRGFGGWFNLCSDVAHLLSNTSLMTHGWMERQEGWSTGGHIWTHGQMVDCVDVMSDGAGVFGEEQWTLENRFWRVLDWEKRII